MSNITIKKINTALAKAGYEEKLTKGEGYFYFYDGDASTWYQSGVYVNYLGALSIEDWVAERDKPAEMQF